MALTIFTYILPLQLYVHVHVSREQLLLWPEYNNIGIVDTYHAEKEEIIGVISK
jgi:hypothetical protein